MILTSGPGAETTYQVILEGCRSPDDFRAGLARLGMRDDQIGRVLDAMPCVLKSNLSLQEAERYKTAFRGAGGDVVVRRQAPTTVELPPPAPPRSAPIPAPVIPAAVIPPPAWAPSSWATPTEIAPAFRGATGSTAAPLEVDERRPTFAPGAVAGTGVRPVAPQFAPAPTGVAVRPSEKQQAVWVEDVGSPWIMRSIVGVIGLVLAFGGLSCFSTYKTAGRLHGFQRAVETDLEQRLQVAGRARNGAATSADLRAAIDDYARQHDVDVSKVDLVEKRLEIEIMPSAPPMPMPMAMEGPMGGAMADGPRMPAFENPYAGCAMGPPPKELTMDQRMEWARLVQACAAPQWLVGVRGTVTTRFGFKKTTVYIERYVFAWNYEAASAVSR